MTREGHFRSLLRALFDCSLLSAFFHYLKDEEIFKVIFAAHFSAFYHNFVFCFFSHVTMSKSEHQSEKNSSSKDISTSLLLYKIKTQRERDGRTIIIVNVNELLKRDTVKKVEWLKKIGENYFKDKFRCFLRVLWGNFMNKFEDVGLHSTFDSILMSKS